MKLPAALLLIEHRRARYIAREEVGCELDARARALERLRHGARQSSLSRSRKVLQEEVTFTHHCGKGQFNNVTLAQQDLLHVVADARESGTKPLALLVT